jgi:hypothetical protein
MEIDDKDPALMSVRRQVAFDKDKPPRRHLSPKLGNEVRNTNQDWLSGLPKTPSYKDGQRMEKYNEDPSRHKFVPDHAISKVHRSALTKLLQRFVEG